MLNCDLKSSADHSSIMGLVLDVLAVGNYYFFETKILAQSQTAELATVEVSECLNPSQRGMMVNGSLHKTAHPQLRASSLWVDNSVVDTKHNLC